MAGQPLRVTVYTVAKTIDLSMTMEAAWDAIRIGAGLPPIGEAPSDTTREAIASLLAHSATETIRKTGAINVVDRAGSVWGITASGYLGIHVEDPEANGEGEASIGFRPPASLPAEAS